MPQRFRERAWGTHCGEERAPRGKPIKPTVTACPALTNGRPLGRASKNPRKHESGKGRKADGANISSGRDNTAGHHNAGVNAYTRREAARHNRRPTRPEFVALRMPALPLIPGHSGKASPHLNATRRNYELPPLRRRPTSRTSPSMDSQMWASTCRRDTAPTHGEWPLASLPTNLRHGF